jgi:hypothetical protein
LSDFLRLILKVLCNDKLNLNAHTVQGVTIACVVSLCALGCVTSHVRVLYVRVGTATQHAIHTNLPSHLQTLLPILFGHYPTQTSTRTLSHFLQGMNTGMYQNNTDSSFTHAMPLKHIQPPRVPIYSQTSLRCELHNLHTEEIQVKKVDITVINQEMRSFRRFTHEVQDNRLLL